jgi:hypothetical protein
VRLAARDRSCAENQQNQEEPWDVRVHEMPLDATIIALSLFVQCDDLIRTIFRLFTQRHQNQRVPSDRTLFAGKLISVASLPAQGSQ